MNQKKKNLILILILIFLLIIINLKNTKEKFTNNIPIYCINLDNAVKRWDSVNNKFNKLNKFNKFNKFNINRFSAVNGKMLKNIDNNKILDTYNTNINSICDKNIKPNITLNLSKGEYGCALSHLNMWELVINKNIDICMIIEDDINPNPSFNNYKTLLKELPKNWDIAYISFLNTGKKIPVSKNIYIPTCGFTTAGYIINLKGAKKLINNLPIEGPIDLFLLSLFRNKKINAYVLDGICNSTNTWGGNDSSIEHSTRDIGKFSNNKKKVIENFSNNKKKVIVIGNAPYEKENMGEIIDNYDIIVRFNNYPDNGYGKHIGEKTDMWCVSDSTYVKNKKLINSRNSIKDKYIVSPYNYKKEHDSIIDTDFKKLLEKRDIDIPSKYNFKDSWPSTGLLVLFYLINKYDDLTIFCFNGFDKDKKSIHYYENLKQWGHKNELEKYVLEDLINQKLIKRL